MTKNYEKKSRFFVKKNHQKTRKKIAFFPQNNRVCLIITGKKRRKMTKNDEKMGQKKCQKMVQKWSKNTKKNRVFSSKKSRLFETTGKKRRKMTKNDKKSGQKKCQKMVKIDQNDKNDQKNRVFSSKNGPKMVQKWTIRSQKVERKTLKNAKNVQKCRKKIAFFRQKRITQNDRC